MRSVTPIAHAFRRRSAAILLFLAAVVPAPALAQMPDIEWSKEDLKALLKVAEAAGEEGLNPDAYSLDMLRQAVLRDVPPPNGLADAIALQLASDYRYGQVAPEDRVEWFTGDVRDLGLLRQIIAQAVAEDRIEETFARLLPSCEGYKALKYALAETPSSDVKRRAALRVNLERWRWMPRELGDKHLFVNIPAYKVELVDMSAVVAAHDAIVGKPSTPTPAFSTSLTAIRFNPGWAVPPGLKAKKLSFYKRNPAAAQRMGYSVT